MGNTAGCCTSSRGVKVAGGDAPTPRKRKPSRNKVHPAPPGLGPAAQPVVPAPAAVGGRGGGSKSTAPHPRGGAGRLPPLPPPAVGGPGGQPDRGLGRDEEPGVVPEAPIGKGQWQLVNTHGEPTPPIDAEPPTLGGSGSGNGSDGATGLTPLEPIERLFSRQLNSASSMDSRLGQAALPPPARPGGAAAPHGVADSGDLASWASGSRSPPGHSPQTPEPPSRLGALPPLGPGKPPELGGAGRPAGALAPIRTSLGDLPSTVGAPGSTPGRKGSMQPRAAEPGEPPTRRSFSKETHTGGAGSPGPALPTPALPTLAVPVEPAAQRSFSKEAHTGGQGSPASPVPVSAEPGAAARFKPGDYVVLTGLSAAAYNGLVCVVKSFAKASHRFLVIVQETGEQRAIKPCNLEPHACMPAQRPDESAEAESDSSDGEENEPDGLPALLTHKFGAPPPPPAGPSPSGGVAGNVDSGSGGGVDGRKEWVSPGSLSGLSGLPPLVDVSKPNPKSKAPLTGAPPPASALKDPLAPPTGRRIQKKPSRQRSADEVLEDEARAADAVSRAVYAHVTNQCHIEPQTVLRNTIRNGRVEHEVKLDSPEKVDWLKIARGGTISGAKMSKARDIEAALIDPGTRANRKIRFNDEADKDLTFIHRFQSTGRVKNLMSTDSDAADAADEVLDLPPVNTMDQVFEESPNEPRPISSSSSDPYDFSNMSASSVPF